jgi:DNA-damage-inducible protein J
MIHVRADEKIKMQVTEKQMPFTLKVPNAETRAAMAEADEIVRTHRARFETVTELLDDLEKNSGK